MFSPFQEKPGPPSSPGHVGHAESLVPTGDKNAGPPPQGVSRFPQVRAYTLCHLCTIQSQIYYLCQNNKEDSKVETLQFSQLITTHTARTKLPHRNKVRKHARLVRNPYTFCIFGYQINYCDTRYSAVKREKIQIKQGTPSTHKDK